jgi:hypothetical protein
MLTAPQHLALLAVVRRFGFVCTSGDFYIQLGIPALLE